MASYKDKGGGSPTGYSAPPPEAEDKKSKAEKDSSKDKKSTVILQSDQYTGEGSTPEKAQKYADDGESQEESVITDEATVDEDLLQFTQGTAGSQYSTGGDGKGGGGAQSDVLTNIISPEVMATITVSAKEQIKSAYIPDWVQVEWELMKIAGATGEDLVPVPACQAQSGVTEKSSNYVFDMTSDFHSLFIRDPIFLKGLGNDLAASSGGTVSQSMIERYGAHDVIRTVLGKVWIRRTVGAGMFMPPIVFAQSGLGTMALANAFSFAKSTYPGDTLAITSDTPRVEQKLSFHAFVWANNQNTSPGAGYIPANPQGPFGQADDDGLYTQERVQITNVTPVPNGLGAGLPAEAVDEASEIWDIWAEWKKNNDLPLFESIRGRLEQDMEGNNPLTRFKYDHVHKISTPFTYKETVEQNISNPLVVKLDPKYNFLIENYESYIGQTPTVPESILPHALLIAAKYQGSSAVQNIADPTGLNHHKFLSLDGAIPNAFITHVVGSTDQETGEFTPEYLKNVTGGQYFDAWALAIEKAKNGLSPAFGAINKNSELQKLANNYKTQILIPKEWSPAAYGSLEKMKGKFPMMVELAFSAPRSGQVMDLLRGGEILPDPESIDFTPSSETTEYPGLWYALLRAFIDGKDPCVEENSVVVPNTYSVGGAPTRKRLLKEMDFLDFLAKFNNVTKSYINMDQTEGIHYIQNVEPVTTIIPTGLTDRNRNETKSLFAAVDLVEGSQHQVTDLSAATNILIEGMDDLIKEKTRTYTEILEGKIACSETLFWKITKHGLDEDGNIIDDPIQTFYYPNIKETNYFELLDSQVKYGKDYVYEITAINIVFGTEYELKNVVTPIVSTGGKFDSHNPDLATWKANTIFKGKAGNIIDPDLWVQEYNSSGNELETWAGDPIFVPSDLDLGWQDIVLEDGFGGYWADADSAIYNYQTKDFLSFLQHSNAAGMRSPTRFGNITPNTQLTVLDGIRPANDPSWGNLLDPLPSNIATHWTLSIDVLSRPSVRIIEAPYHSTLVKILDRPPLPPLVTTVPYKDMNDKYLLTLEGNTGELNAEPISLRLEDEELIEKQILAQGSPEPPMLNFYADDTPEAFEIFRIDPPETESEIMSNENEQFYPPTSYDSFRKKANYRQLLAPDTVSKSLVENIKPNLTYYYTFRSKDHHDNISNPTEVYEIKIVDDGGAVYLLTRLYEFPKIKRTNTKKMKKYLNLVPVLEQTMKVETEEQNTNSTNVKLGTAEDSIFDSGKTFKIRLTSKKTGRKMDVNVKFDIKNNITKEEKDPTNPLSEI